MKAENCTENIIPGLYNILKKQPAVIAKTCASSAPLLSLLVRALNKSEIIKQQQIIVFAVSLKLKVNFNNRF